MNSREIQEVRAFNRVYTVFMGILNQRFLKSRFSLVETRVMHAVLTQEGIMPSEIVTLLNIDKSYLSRIVTSLIKRRILGKKKSIADGRSIQLSITELGKKEFEKLNEASNLQVAELLAQFTDEERYQLITCMTEIRSVLEKH